MGKYNKTNKMKVTTKTAVSKSELRAARRREKRQTDEALSTKREAAIATIVPIPVPTVTFPVTDFNDYDIYDDFNEKGLSIDTICTKYNLTVKQVEDALMAVDYQKGHTYSSLTKKYKCSTKRVSKALNEHGVVKRHRGGANNISKTKDGYLIIPKTTDDLRMENNIPVEKTEESKIEVEVKEEPPVVEEKKEIIDISRSEINFCCQSYVNTKLQKVVMENKNVLVAGLVKDRHEIVSVDTYVFEEELTEKFFKDPTYATDRVTGFINANMRDEKKTLVLYCTGLQLALSAVVSVCLKKQINLITMHYNSETKSYFPQVTINLFGEVPEILNVSSIQKLEIKYRGGIYTYDCTVEDLLAQENCLAISLSNVLKTDKDIIILTNKEIPDVEFWKLFSDFIFISRADENPFKKQSIQMINIKFDQNKYWFDDLPIARSFNWKNDRK